MMTFRLFCLLRGTQRGLMHGHARRIMRLTKFAVSRIWKFVKMLVSIFLFFFAHDLGNRLIARRIPLKVSEIDIGSYLLTYSQMGVGDRG